MSRIIINNKSKAKNERATAMVGYVIRQGLVSETSRGPQYCFATLIGPFVVYCDKNKSGTYTFTVKDELK